MEDIEGIIRKRSSPGILILDRLGWLCYANPQALALLAPSGVPDGEEVPIPSQILSLYTAVKADTNAPGREDTCSLMLGNTPCAVRAFLLGAGGGQVMVLLEKVVEKHLFDTEKAQREFHLSKRETDVVTFICKGLANRAISEKLFISEYTVKDHIKNIMKKMGVGSRHEVVSALR